MKMDVHLKGTLSDISIQTLSTTVLGYFGFDRALYENKKNISKRKWRWFEELRQERERDIKAEITEKHN
jgi:hypothetical protein